MLTAIVHIWNLLTLTSSIIEKTYELALFLKKSVENFIITKVCTKTLKIVKLSRIYTKAKSFPLTKTVIPVSNSPSGPPSPFVGVFYQASAITEKDELSYYGNATQNSKLYFRTSKDVLQKAREKCVNGLNVKTEYDEINNKSGGDIIGLHKGVNYKTCGK